ncbi:MAG TPA: hypothetical protein PKY77_22020 [Phycisphaerae bacterium]|nr:hypothetical protein [Phycisphaerae bacterium]
MIVDSINTGRAIGPRNRPRNPGCRRAVYGKLYDPLLDIRLRRNEPFGIAVENILKTLRADKGKVIAAGVLARSCLYSYGTGYNALRWLREHDLAGCTYAQGRSWYAWKEPAAGSRACRIMVELGVLPPPRAAAQPAPTRRTGAGRLRRMVNANRANGNAMGTGT